MLNGSTEPEWFLTITDKKSRLIRCTILQSTNKSKNKEVYNYLNWYYNVPLTVNVTVNALQKMFNEQIKS